MTLCQLDACLVTAFAMKTLTVQDSTGQDTISRQIQKLFRDWCLSRLCTYYMVTSICPLFVFVHVIALHVRHQSMTDRASTKVYGEGFTHDQSLLVWL